MSDDIPFSEFEQYPEMTKSQKDVMTSVGIALFGIHGAENYLKFVLSYIFPADEGATWTDLLAEDQRRRKDTLGRMITRLREQAIVDPDFEALLSRFLFNRNRFVHGLLVEPGFIPDDDEGIANIRTFLNELEHDCWYITSILRGYATMFVKVMGFDDIIPTDSITFKNNHKYFAPVIDFKDLEDRRT